MGSSVVDVLDIVFVCLCEGILVCIVCGDIVVEDLVSGELIVVEGGEIQVFGRVLSSCFGVEELVENFKFYLVWIVVGVLGVGLFVWDLLVLC